MEIDAKKIGICILAEDGTVHYVRMPVEDRTRVMSNGNVIHLVSEEQLISLYEAIGAVISKVRPIRSLRTGYNPVSTRG